MVSSYLYLENCIYHAYLYSKELLKWKPDLVSNNRLICVGSILCLAFTYKVLFGGYFEHCVDSCCMHTRRSFSMNLFTCYSAPLEIHLTRYII